MQRVHSSQTSTARAGIVSPGQSDAVIADGMSQVSTTQAGLVSSRHPWHVPSVDRLGRSCHILHIGHRG
jgi:hypothetical protein